MAKNSRKCGPNATEEWEHYPHYRSHRISGEGSITSCFAIQNSNDEDSFSYKMELQNYVMVVLTICLFVPSLFPQR